MLILVVGFIFSSQPCVLVVLVCRGASHCRLKLRQLGRELNVKERMNHLNCVMSKWKTRKENDGLILTFPLVDRPRVFRMKILVGVEKIRPIRVCQSGNKHEPLG